MAQYCVLGFWGAAEILNIDKKPLKNRKKIHIFIEHNIPSSSSVMQKKWFFATLGYFWGIVCFYSYEMLWKDGMLCTLSPGFMPEGMRAGGKGVLVQAPPSLGGPIYLAFHGLARHSWFGSHRHRSQRLCPSSLCQNLDLIPKVCPPLLSYATYIGPCHNKAVMEQYRWQKGDKFNFLKQ
jgi:hypothetical protein